MTNTMDVIVTNPQAAHAAVTEGYRIAKALTMAGNRARIVVGQDEADRSLRQLRFYWGPCLGEIAEQASIGGQRYAAEAWHELMKRQFLGYEIEKVKVAGRKKTTVIRRLRSTSKLKVKAMGVYLEKVQAFAVTDLGVTFSLRSWEEYR